MLPWHFIPTERCHFPLIHHFIHLYLALFNNIYFPLHFKIFFLFFWKPQEPQATLILSRTLLGLKVDTLGYALDLFLRAAALGLVSHFLALMSSSVSLEQSNRPTLCHPSIHPVKVHCVVLLGLGPFHFISFVLSWPFSLRWDDVAGLHPEITQVIQRPGFLLCAFDWYKIRTALRP